MRKGTRAGSLSIFYYILFFCHLRSPLTYRVRLAGLLGDSAPFCESPGTEKQTWYNTYLGKNPVCGVLFVLLYCFFLSSAGRVTRLSCSRRSAVRDCSFCLRACRKGSWLKHDNEFSPTNQTDLPESLAIMTSRALTFAEICDKMHLCNKANSYVFTTLPPYTSIECHAAELTH